MTSKSFNPVQAAIEKIRAFAFVANDDLLAQIDQLDQRLGQTTANTLTQTTLVSSGLASLLTSVNEAVNDASRQTADLAQFGRLRRSVRVLE